ncbi:MIP/aquaporin family protein [Homoserinibacter sp. GY 40078]|uniref:aquaporin n=1 Tax=Homoserinibacter sp. GY 40078 TaxID=2603275 RepID=UPI0011CA3FBF|nr:MIP/aquaporin family protein [Homoserinibacter sp. GY 40078]TXK19047.1 aquaporin family protein [Homoserinibacter sp. GY 40078]
MNGPGIRPVAAEFVGSALLCTVVVGSGAAAEQLSADAGVALLINALATVMGLGVLIVVFAPISGAHFNPIVTIADVVLGERPARGLLVYLPAQIVGCVAGAALANLMFEHPPLEFATADRATPAHLLAEVVAASGLVFVIFALLRLDRASVIPVAVASYIGAAYFFTSSTSFANPAITIGRMFSDTFAGIAPASVPWYVGAQLVGCVLAVLLVRALVVDRRTEAAKHPVRP